MALLRRKRLVRFDTQVPTFAGWLEREILLIQNCGYMRLGRVDGFDQDEAQSKGDKGGVVLVGFLAP